MDFRAFEQDGLVLAAQVRSAGEDTRVLRDAERRGELRRIRRGAYCLPDRWAALSSRQRHVLVARAVLVARTQGILAGRTAAALWRLPHAAGESDPVTLLVPVAGGAGSGLRAWSVGVDRVHPVEVDGLLCTDLTRTACDVARRAEFSTAVMVVDAARSVKRHGRVELSALLAEVDAASAAGERGAVRLRRAIDFSTDLSGSAGESLARVAIHRAGFAKPTLQRRFVDDEGEMFPDFWWPDVGVAVEFDGKVKYTRQEYTRGDPSEVVWREKRREDRLRRQVSRVERLIYSDVRDAARLRRILLSAGVPLRALGGRARAL